MRRFLNAFVMILSTAFVSGCGDATEDSQVSATRMDDIENLEGTISDEMINSDESADEAPLDAAPSVEGKPKVKEEKDIDDLPKEEVEQATTENADAE